jgi:2-polyprenyl-6-methoxyphenol hydroxylase-like FAD-dependent oxidoreductase
MVDGRAVVVGAGMAGLVAAAVLSRRFAQVTVLDRDTLPAGATPRKGVPQGAQPHVLLVSGLRELAGLFPGFDDELVAAGASRFDTGLGLCTYRLGSRWPQVATGLDLVSVSRPLLEATVRQRVAAAANVTIREGVTVSALTGSASGVTGVVLDSGDHLAAELVVDASGRSSRSDRWLGALGFPAPAQTEIKVGVGYSTRTYRRTPGGLDGWQAAFVLPTAPHEKRHGLVVPVEGDRWLVSVGGWHIGAPPATVAEFEEFAHSLPDPIVADLIDAAEPLGEPRVYRFPSSRRRHFEKLDRIPAGYVPVGDAICSFNPIYGQGMTCAVFEAVALGRALDSHGTTDAAMARDYLKSVTKIIATPWQFAVGGDFAHPETVGPRPRGQAVSTLYVRWLSGASQRDPEINRTFVAVQQLLTPPSALFRPAMVAKVLRFALHRKHRPATTH